MSRVLALCLALVLPSVSAAQVATPSAPASQPAAASNAPTTRPAIATPDELLRRLADPDWRHRQEALHQLVDLGPQADVMLNDLLQRELPHDDRKNVELAAEQLREYRDLGPSLITLHVKDALPADVFHSVTQQCSGKLPTWPDGLWDQPGWPRLTLNYDRKPFWEVMAELGKQLQVDYISNDPQEICLTRDSGHVPAGMCISGAFLLTLEARTFRNGMSLELSVFGEPKVAVTRTVSYRVDRLLDDQGKPILPLTSRRWFGRRFRTGSRELSLPFQRPPEEVSRISKFDGAVTVAVQTKSQLWEVLNPVSMAPVTRVVDGVPVTLDSFGPLSGSDNFELQVDIPVGWSSAGTIDEMTELIRQRMRVVDQAGNALNVGSVTKLSPDNEKLTADFSPAVLSDGTKTGAPVKLLWEIPTQTRNLAVPFSFKDVQIADPFN